MSTATSTVQRAETGTETLPGRWAALAKALTSRRGAWVVLVLAVLVAAGLSGALGKSDPPGAASSLPAASQSAQVKQLQKQFPNAELAPVIAVVTRTDGQPLTSGDLTAATSIGTVLDRQVGQAPSPLTRSADDQAALINVAVDTDRDNTEIAGTINQLRNAAQENAPAGLSVQITGGPAFGADIASAFDGANVTLLAVTVAVVALLLLLTYRSPVLWLVPLVVTGIADQVANTVTARMGQAWDLQFDAGIISVLVFGAGTNYALLLISRYREELGRTTDHRTALTTAWQATAPAILASNITVVLSLLTLVFAAMPSTRGLGIASAAGLVIALAFALLVLPAALAVSGRRLFWPFIPRTGAAAAEGGLWLRIARAVTRRPAVVVAASFAILAMFAAGLLGTRVGLSQTEQFRVASESADGFSVLARHFPPGESAPMTVMTSSGQASQVADAAAGAAGIVRATVTSESGTGWTKITVVGTADPDTAPAYQEVRDVRAAVQAVPGAEAVVGGQNAESLDVKDAAQQDLTRIAPLILGVALFILIGLLRAILAPVLLVLVNLVSAVAAIGLGTWVGKHLFGFPALDVNVPLIAFLFLVALGIDYTIFLVHRALQLAPSVGTREAITRAVSHTGAVITSAGIVLAAVFAALGVLPLVTLGQLGLIVGLGVLVDTLVVRTVVVPAVFALVGDRIWWPRQIRTEV